jgi:protoheme IX farnesyltransferase
MTAGAPGISHPFVPRARAWTRDVLILSKPRITSMVLVVTVFGYLMAPQRASWVALASAMLGALLVGAGGNALNQYMERESDKLMRRTRERPLPAGRMSPQAVLTGGVGTVAAGIAVLAVGANLLAAAVAGVVVITYVLCYTPLKSRTGLNTLVGAVPGALPPVLGWASAAGSLELGALALFLILFVWQLPHFLAIAWMYRDEYAAASLPMLTVADPDGGRTRRQMVLYATLLIPVSLYPAVIGLAGRFYFFSALVLGGLFLGACLVMVARPTELTARVAMRASLIYLPALFALMYFDAPRP